ncbi:MAG: hypothetical protein ACSW8I_09405 [bacterium]
MKHTAFTFQLSAFTLLLLLLTACSREEVEAPLYRQYAARKNLTVAQVTGFQLNDSVKVDVVILVADDSAAWSGLKQEFDIRTSEGVTSWMGDIDHPRKRVKRTVRPAWRAMAVHDSLTIAFYRIDSEIQREALMDYQLNKLKIKK